MSKTIAVLSLGYWFSAYTLGLLLHPYKTVRELVRRKQMGAMVGVPLVWWGFLWISGMVGLRFGWLVLWIVGLEATPRFINILAFLFWWLTFFIALWQAVVGYLWIRFTIVNRE